MSQELENSYRNKLLDARKLNKSYRRSGGMFAGNKDGELFTVVDGVSFAVEEGETFAIVGESGCGKTTLARMLLRLIEPDGGEILIQGRNLLHLNGGELPLPANRCK